MNKYSLAIKKILYGGLCSGSFIGWLVYYICGCVYWLFSSGRFYVGTRVVEIPWIYAKIREHANKSNLFQLGDVLSRKGLASNRVCVVDMNAIKDSCDNFIVYKKDLREVELHKSFFDMAVSVSTVEHIGLWKICFNEGDAYTIKRIYALLKDNALFAFTVPFGKHVIRDGFRVYDRKSLLNILKDYFDIVEEKYISWNGWRWIYVEANVAEQMPFIGDNKDMNCGAALILARKK